MIHALRTLAESPDDPVALALLESQLLGALMICPYLRLDCGTLRPADFASPHRGAAFQAILDERHPELSLVVDRLDRDGHRPPPTRAGWADALARTLDVAFVDDDAVPEAVQRIKDAALARKIARRLSAA
ncbi:MAG: hypothetical protein RBU36_12685 [Thermoanaerobaculia bacterium]|nr:hypothetical protein [Thermoanaerobaculia bacterium]